LTPPPSPYALPPHPYFPAPLGSEPRISDLFSYSPHVSTALHSPAMILSDFCLSPSTGELLLAGGGGGPGCVKPTGVALATADGRDAPRTRSKSEARGQGRSEREEGVSLCGGSGQSCGSGQSSGCRGRPPEPPPPAGEVARVLALTCARSHNIKHTH
jgi:hypothetical protein